jgi:hypothetical protein
LVVEKIDIEKVGSLSLAQGALAKIVLENAMKNLSHIPMTQRLAAFQKIYQNAPIQLPHIELLLQ